MCKTSTKFDFHSVRNTRRLEFDTPAAPLCAIADRPNVHVYRRTMFCSTKASLENVRSTSYALIIAPTRLPTYRASMPFRWPRNREETSMLWSTTDVAVMDSNTRVSRWLVGR